MRRTVLTAALLLNAIAAHALAQPLSVRITPCPGSEPDVEVGLARVLSVELRGDGYSVMPAAPQHSLVDVSLRAPCGDSSVDVVVRNPRDGQTFSRRVELAGVPYALRLRVLAMSTAELLRVIRAREAQLPPPPDPPPPRVILRPSTELALPAAPSPARERISVALAAPDDDAAPSDVASADASRSSASPPSRARASGEAGGALRSLPRSDLVLVGGNVGATVSFDGAFALTLRGGVLGNEVSSPFDGAALLLVPLSVGFSGRAASLGDLRLDLGVRLEGGPAFANERRTPSANALEWTTHGYFLAAATLETSTRLGDSVEAYAFADVGWVFAGFDVRVASAALSSVRGLSVGTGLGLRVLP